MRRSLVLLAIATLAFALEILVVSRKEPAERPRRFPSPPTVVRATTKGTSSGKLPETTRAPSSEKVVDFLRESDGEWRVQRNAQGFVAKLAGGTFHLSDPEPEQAAEVFLRKYARGLLGVSAPDLRRTGQRHVGPFTQITYDQSVEGLEVIGSRVNLLIDSGGSLVYLSATISPGPNPSPKPKLTPLEAAAVVGGALPTFLARYRSPVSLPAYETESLAQSLQLSYRLREGSISLVYKAELPFAAPAFGTFEVMVGASNGALVTLRDLTKK